MKRALVFLSATRFLFGIVSTRGAFGSPPNSFSIFSAESRSLPSKRWPWVFIVSLMDE
jgi:hypothetical protein